MFKIFKHIKSIFLLKQVADVYKAETEKDKPIWMSRRFFGTAITVAGGLLVSYQGIDFGALGGLDALTKHILIIQECGIRAYQEIKYMIPSIVIVYGVVMGVIGQLKRKKK